MDHLIEMTTALRNVITTSTPVVEQHPLNSLANHPQLHVLIDLLLTITSSSSSTSKSEVIAIVILQTLAKVVSSTHTAPILVLV